MKKLVFAVFAVFVIIKLQGGVPPGAQGIGINPPKAMLEIKGEIKIDSARSTPIYDGTIQYKSGQFLFRQGGSWLPLGSSDKIGSGLTKTNDTISLGGRISENMVFTNSIDTIMTIDSSGQITLPLIYELESNAELGFIIDSVARLTTNGYPDSLLTDSLLNGFVLNGFGVDDTDFCYALDTIGVLDKILFKDGNKLVIDTTNFGSCSGTQEYTLLQFTFAPLDIPKGMYVDSAIIYFSSYDTLNVNGNSASEGYPLYSISQGNKIISQHYSGNGDSIIAPMGNPIDIGDDTIGIINFHFPEKQFNIIDSISLTIFIPLNTNYQISFDRIAVIAVYKPDFRQVMSVGGQLVTVPFTNSGGSGSTTLSSGNGVQISGLNETGLNEINLGDLNADAMINAQNNYYSIYNVRQFGIDGLTANITGINTAGYYGVTLDGRTNSSFGLNQIGRSVSNTAINIDGLSDDGVGIRLVGGCINQISSDIEIYPTNGNLTISNLATDNTANRVLAKNGSNKSVWRDISSLPSNNVTAGNGLRNVDASTVALNNSFSPLTDNVNLHGGNNDNYIWLSGYGVVSNYPGISLFGENSSPSNEAFRIIGSNSGSADDIIINPNNGKLSFYSLPDTNNVVAVLGKLGNGRSAWISNTIAGTAALATNTAITTDFSTYIMDFTSGGAGSSSNELPALSTVPNGFTVRIRRTDNNSSFTVTIIPYTGSGDIITDLDNANISAIGISDGIANNYLEFTAFINGVNGYGGSTKWVVMNKH